MDERYEELWDKFLKNSKIWKIKAIRAWHRFDKEFGVSRFAKKMVLAAGLKLITLAAPNAQVSLHAQTAKHRQKAVAAKVTKVDETSQLLAKVNETSSTIEFAKFMEENRDLIVERQKAFALAYWETLQKNISTIKGAEAKGTRSRTSALRKLFGDYKKYGITVDPSYFCATGGLGSYAQTVEKGGFDEYKLLFDCLSNPNSCSAIIKDLKKHFGNQKETNDIQKTLADIYKKNPYAVCMCFPHSRSSRSGYHYVTAFSNAIAVDTLITSEDSIRGKTARFNHTNITDTQEYFSSGQNKGYVFDVTKMFGNYQVFKMYMDYIEEMQKQKLIPQKIIIGTTKSFEPVTMTNEEFFEKPSHSWKEVSSMRNSASAMRQPAQRNVQIISRRKKERSV